MSGQGLGVRVDTCFLFLIVFCSVFLAGRMNEGLNLARPPALDTFCIILSDR